jgi:hypothetical protein
MYDYMEKLTNTGSKKINKYMKRLRPHDRSENFYDVRN